MDLEKLEALIIEELQGKIQKRQEIMSSLDILYVGEKQEENNKNESYENIGDMQIIRDHYDITPPFPPYKLAPEIYTKNKFVVPTIVVTIERLLPRYKELVSSVFNHLPNTGEMEDGNGLILRFESYELGIQKKEYVINNDIITFSRNLEGDGKIFLPLIN